ncbi:MAG: hypothetical protein PUE05_04415, partial [bacterium]|nr:hypothetical protein [bacterium]
FFREAAFFSGGEGCEWRAQRATVGKSGDKAENEFSGFIPLAVPRKGLALTSPPPDFLFSSIPLSHAQPHQIKQPPSKIASNKTSATKNITNHSQNLHRPHKMINFVNYISTQLFSFLLILFKV